MVDSDWGLAGVLLVVAKIEKLAGGVDRFGWRIKFIPKVVVGLCD